MPLTSKISQDYSADMQFQLKSARFGSGYQQVAPVGYTTALETISVSWKNLPTADRDTVIAAFTSSGGYDYFTYQPVYSAVSKKYLMKDGAYKLTNPAANLWSISATSV